MAAPVDHDALVLGTPESIVLDGANAVMGDPRAHFPRAGLSLGLSAAMLVLGVLFLRRRPRWLALLLAASMLPGLWQVVAVRADAVPHRGELARAVRRTLDDVQAKAPWPGPVRVVREDDDVLFPLVRYAVPTRPPVSGPAVELEVRAGPLGAPCGLDPVSGHLVCGAGP
ncbi:MAG: hypothetical protein IPJ65_41095 [Archangiaceae bacterium]|nr:hypothetical protein [Archangiaceae bacterium]